MDNAIFSAFSKVAELNRSNNKVIPNLPLSVPLFSAKGDERALAQGIELAVNMLRSKVSHTQKNGAHCRRPWLLVITDGQGTDVWKDTAVRLKHWSEEKAIIPIIINVGQNEDSLSEYSTIPVFQDAMTVLDDLLNWVRECLQLITNAEHGGTVHLPIPPIRELV